MQCTAKNKICFSNMFVRTYEMLGLFYATKVNQTKIKTKRPLNNNVKPCHKYSISKATK